MTWRLGNKIRERAAQFIEPGEHIEAVFSAKTTGASGGDIVDAAEGLRTRFRSVVVTDRRIVILNTGAISRSRPKNLEAVLPRTTVIHPDGASHWPLRTLNEPLFVDRRWRREMRRADDIQRARN